MPVRLLPLLIAVVSLAAVNDCLALGRARNRRQIGNATDLNSSTDWLGESEEASLEAAAARWLSPRESQLLLRREGGEGGMPVDCCPSTLEMIEPQGGTNRDGMLVQLFAGPNNRQRFFELSCRVGVEGKPCRFMDRHLHNQSRCVQKYSYTYALVRQPEQEPGAPTANRLSNQPFTSFPSDGSNWMLDYIQVRSGCSCEVLPRAKRRRPKSKKGKD